MALASVFTSFLAGVLFKTEMTNKNTKGMLDDLLMRKSQALAPQQRAHYSKRANTVAPHHFVPPPPDFHFVPPPPPVWAPPPPDVVHFVPNPPCHDGNICAP